MKQELTPPTCSASAGPEKLLDILKSLGKCYTLLEFAKCEHICIFLIAIYQHSPLREMLDVDFFSC